MKKLVFLFVLLLSTKLWADTTQAENFFTKDLEINKAIDKIYVDFTNPDNKIEANILKYNELLAIFDVFKTLDLSLGERLLYKVNNREPLSGDDLYFLRKTIATYYKINKKILDFSKVYLNENFSLSSVLANPEMDLRKVKGHLIFISGHLEVIDHIVKMHQLYYESSGLFRRIVKKALKDKNQHDSKTINDLIKMSEYVLDMGNKKDFRNKIILVRNIKDELQKVLATDEASLQLLNVIITNETSIEIARGKKDFSVSYHSFIDALGDVFSKITNWFSKFFGNIAGSIRWRKGYMYENETAIGMMKEKLRPMDVLLEKTPFSLTDKFIPGHYGHAALYLGTKKQLEEINMWNHPDIAPYQEEIEDGNVILEALRSGVKLSTLEEFSNIDEYTIIRKNDALIDVNALIEGIARGMDQIGKEYDFNFDVETLDKIVCSELIYIIYGQVKWPTKYRLGRATISPDDVAEVMFHKNNKFDLIDYIVSPERHRIETGSITALANELSFELRSEDGSPVTEPNDETNSFWKKEEKCYTVSNGMNEESTRECKTVYTLIYYAERTVGN